MTIGAGAVAQLVEHLPGPRFACLFSRESSGVFNSFFLGGGECGICLL